MVTIQSISLDIYPPKSVNIEELSPQNKKNCKTLCCHAGMTNKGLLPTKLEKKKKTRKKLKLN